MPRSEREKHLFRYRPRNRLKALRRYYDHEQRATLAFDDGDGLALLLQGGEGIPFTCFRAGEPMVALYGVDPYAPEEIVCRGYLTLARLLKTKPGGGRRVRSLNERYETPLSARQVERLQDLAHGRMPRLGVRQRLSPLAKRLVAA